MASSGMSVALLGRGGPHFAIGYSRSGQSAFSLEDCRCSAPHAVAAHVNGQKQGQVHTHKEALLV